jgi:hypothetical protein
MTCFSNFSECFLRGVLFSSSSGLPLPLARFSFFSFFVFELLSLSAAILVSDLSLSVLLSVFSSDLMVFASELLVVEEVVDGGSGGCRYFSKQGPHKSKSQPCEQQKRSLTPEVLQSLPSHL